MFFNGITVENFKIFSKGFTAENVKNVFKGFTAKTWVQKRPKGPNEKSFSSCEKGTFIKNDLQKNSFFVFEF